VVPAAGPLPPTPTLEPLPTAPLEPAPEPSAAPPAPPAPPPAPPAPWAKPSVAGPAIRAAANAVYRIILSIFAILSAAHDQAQLLANAACVERSPTSQQRVEVGARRRAVRIASLKACRPGGRVPWDAEEAGAKSVASLARWRLNVSDQIERLVQPRPDGSPLGGDGLHRRSDYPRRSLPFSA
jgi:hypothetical protein